MNRIIRQFGLIGLLFLAGGGLVNAQIATSKPTIDSRSPADIDINQTPRGSAESDDPLEPRINLIAAAEKHKAAAQQLVQFQEQELAGATEKHKQLRQLVAEGLVARIELEASERSLKDLQTRLAAARQQIAEADKVVGEVRIAEELGKPQAVNVATPAKTRTLVRPTVLRYQGSVNWSIANLAPVQAFFLSTFGRMLPTSAVGQSATHNRLGWDHRHAVDVPLHPDSAEGKALIDFLQTKGIPFLAFRGAIAGVSTGPHIHIGRPSHRLG